MLPLKIPHKEEKQKEAELAYAKQYEMNIILNLIGIREWEKPQIFTDSDMPMGVYNEEKLTEYTKEDFDIEIYYFFENYEELNGEPLIQTIKIHKNDTKTGCGMIMWNGHTIIDSKMMGMT